MGMPTTGSGFASEANGLQGMNVGSSYPGGSMPPVYETGTGLPMEASHYSNGSQKPAGEVQVTI